MIASVFMTLSGNITRFLSHEMPHVAANRATIHIGQSFMNNVVPVSKKILSLLLIVFAFAFTSCLEDGDARKWRKANEAFMKGLKDSTNMLVLEHRDSVISAEKGGVYEPAPVSGILYQEIKAGTGEIPVIGQMVTVKYTGWLYDNTQFDAGKISFKLGDTTVDGFREVVERMPVGARWKAYIPYYLGYGSTDYHYSDPMIPAYSVLIFDMELIKIGE